MNVTPHVTVTSRDKELSAQVTEAALEMGEDAFDVDLEDYH